MGKRKPETYDEMIGGYVRHWRTIRKMSLQKLTAMIDYEMSYQMLQKYESGKSRWPAALVIEVAHALAVGMDSLMPQLDSCGKVVRPEHLIGVECPVENIKTKLIGMDATQLEIADRMIDSIKGGGE